MPAHSGGDQRAPYLDDTLKKFPFVNGGLFKDEIDFPNFTPEIKNLLLDEASGGFDWSQISPRFSARSLSRRASRRIFEHQDFRPQSQKNPLAFQDKLEAEEIF